MRSAATMSSCALLIVAGSWPAGHARADDIPVPPITNMCTGVLAPEATFSIVVKQPNGSFLAIDRNLTGSVISGADCACDVQDLFLQAYVSKGLPNGTQPTFSVFEGSACNEVQPRTTTCEQVAATVAPSDFWSGSSNTNPQQRIDVPALLTPDPNAS